MNNYLVLDVETTIKNRGHPFTKSNKLVLTGWLSNGESPVTMKGLEYVPEALQEKLEQTIIVGFNIKFDLHWLRRSGCHLDSCTIWDCQLAEFILGNQKERLPSLSSVAVRRGLGDKLDVVSTEYWAKGIDTDAVPEDILKEYLIQDLKLTEQIYLQQVEEFKKQPEKYRLFKLECMDVLVLQEMEWNGLLYNKDESLRKAAELDLESQNIVANLNRIVGTDVVNWNSNDHLSCVLYGGTITETVKVPIGVFKSGAKIGQVRYKNELVEHKFPRLVTPLPKSNLEKEGYWATNEKILTSLKCRGKPKEIIDNVLLLSKVDKMNGTYYKGLPALIEEMEWTNNIIHGTLNKCIAVTGRLSSSKPNQQNMPEEVFNLITSRF